MTTAAHTSTAKPAPTGPVVLTMVTLVVASVAASVSLWLMPVAGAALMFVGGSGSTYDVPRQLSYPVTVMGVLVLLASIPVFVAA